MKKKKKKKKFKGQMENRKEFVYKKKKKDKEEHQEGDKIILSREPFFIKEIYEKKFSTKKHKKKMTQELSEKLERRIFFKAGRNYTKRVLQQSGLLPKNLWT